MHVWQGSTRVHRTPSVSGSSWTVDEMWRLWEIASNHAEYSLQLSTSYKCKNKNLHAAYYQPQGIDQLLLLYVNNFSERDNIESNENGKKDQRYNHFNFMHHTV